MRAQLLGGELHSSDVQRMVRCLSDGHNGSQTPWILNSLYFPPLLGVAPGAAALLWSAAALW